MTIQLINNIFGKYKVTGTIFKFTSETITAPPPPPAKSTIKKKLNNGFQDTGHQTIKNSDSKEMENN